MDLRGEIYPQIDGCCAEVVKKRHEGNSGMGEKHEIPVVGWLLVLRSPPRFRRFSAFVVVVAPLPDSLPNLQH